LSGDSIKLCCVCSPVWQCHRGGGYSRSKGKALREKNSLLAKEKFPFECVFCMVGHLVLGLASALEAFRREPPCDSIGALVVRQTPETRGTAWEFLSYYPILPSRYLQDPFNNPTNEVAKWKIVVNIVRQRYQVRATVGAPRADPFSFTLIFLAIPS
jgi:hypothetical protein